MANGVPGEKWIGRSARVWASILAILGIVLPYLGYNPMDVIPILERIGSEGAATGAMVLALVHLVRKSWDKLRALPRTPGETLASALVIAAIVAGCATYDAARVRQLADENVGAAVFTADECDDMARASVALRQGPDRTLRGLGRAGDLQSIADALQAHAAECREVIRRRTLSQEHRQRIRAAFDGTWKAAAAAVE